MIYAHYPDGPIPHVFSFDDMDAYDDAVHWCVRQFTSSGYQRQTREFRWVANYADAMLRHIGIYRADDALQFWMRWAE
jgi:hypothetical protein